MNKILNSGNIDSIVNEINEVTKNKTYWLSTGSGKHESVDDPNFDDRWFSSDGNFERLFTLTAKKDNSGKKIILSHKSIIDKKIINPESFEITSGFIIKTDKNDLLIFNNINSPFPKGVSTMYMEKTEERCIKYSDAANKSLT